jgi:hypothetical protein
MDILKLMKEKEQEFSALQSKAREVNDELIMIQGEYRLLRKLGIKEGVLDVEGNPLKPEK